MTRLYSIDELGIRILILDLRLFKSLIDVISEMLMSAINRTESSLSSDLSVRVLCFAFILNLNLIIKK